MGAPVSLYGPDAEDGGMVDTESLNRCSRWETIMSGEFEKSSILGPPMSYFSVSVVVAMVYASLVVHVVRYVADTTKIFDEATGSR